MKHQTPADENYCTPAARIHGGAHPAHRKHTAAAATVTMPPPDRVVIPMQQHIGAPCIPTVKKGDTVYVGTLIGDSDKPVSAPIHASVSGTVIGITEILLPGGQKTAAVEIESDGFMTPDPSLQPHPVETREELVAAARACGLVGLGGAGFPASVKLNPRPGVELDTLLVNGAECEPYLTADYRECIEDADALMKGIYLIQRVMGFRQVIIAIENNKPKAIQILHDIAADQQDADNSVRVLPLPSSYPQGAEKVLIYTATGRKVPAGKLPADVGCVVMNVTSIGTLMRFIETGMPLVSKRLTVDGSAIAAPKNVRVPIGTRVKDVVAFCGGYTCTPAKLLYGGPMMGMALMDDDMPVLKQNNGILAFDHKDAATQPVLPCIRCGRCMNACPMQLQPAGIARAMQLGADLKKLHVNYCMECGCCAYACPSHRPLVQTMRLAKARLQKEAAK